MSLSNENDSKLALKSLLSPFLLLTAVAVAAIWSLTTPYMAWATAAYLMMVYGLWHRKNRAIHVRQMRIALGADLVLVLLLEFARDAIGTALAFKLGPLQQFHILFSTLAVVLYFPVYYLGNKRLKNLGTVSTRTWHVRLALTAFGLRTIGFILMFSLLAKTAT